MCISSDKKNPHKQRDSSSPPSTDLSTSRVHHIKNPQAFISSLSVALVPFFNVIGPPHPWIFHPIRGISKSYVIEQYVQYKDPWMGVVHESFLRCLADNICTHKFEQPSTVWLSFTNA